MVQVEIFEISFDANQAVYRESDVVCGVVFIKNPEDIKYKALHVELCGVAIVTWKVDTSGRVLDPDNIKGEHNTETYFLETIPLAKRGGGFLDKDPVLPAGEHTFPFECKLPQQLPSSFEGKFGQIRYLARATIERAWKSSVVTRKAFTVLSGLDLNFIPEAAVKIELCKYKSLGGCCGSGSVIADWTVARSGYVPGEDIHVNGAIQNESGDVVACSKATLYMVIDYHSKKRRAQERREVASVSLGETSPGNVTVWQETIHIPPLPPTGLDRCRLIDINYELQLKAIIEGCSPICFTKDIYIGTVPMSRREMKSCVAGMFNQPYQESMESLDVLARVSQSQLSLTQLVAVAGACENQASPSAPSATTLGRPEICTSPQLPDGERPPPYAPGHYDPTDAPLRPSPTAPSARANAPEAPLLEKPIFEPSMFGAVSLRETADDEQSMRGDLSYAPVYPYYGTCGAHKPPPV